MKTTYTFNKQQSKAIMGLYDDHFHSPYNDILWTMKLMITGMEVSSSTDPKLTMLTNAVINFCEYNALTDEIVIEL